MIKYIRGIKSMLCMYSLLKKKVRLLNCMRAQIMAIVNKCAMFKALKSMVG